MNIVYPADQSTASLRELIERAKSDVLFIGDPRVEINPGARMFERMEQVIRDGGAGMVSPNTKGPILLCSYESYNTYALRLFFRRYKFLYR